MGQAKRRGTYEERKAQAIARTRMVTRATKKPAAMTPNQKAYRAGRSRQMGNLMLLATMAAAMSMPSHGRRAV